MNNFAQKKADGYGYFAFISYNKKDVKWGKRLQRKLEGYILPTALRKETGYKRAPLNPIFFAPSDIQPGNSLPEEIKEKLRDSKYLIVVCSPRSAGSFWVGREIAYFCELGRQENILCFIIDGDPESREVEKRCYHPKLLEVAPDTFGANIQEETYKFSWLNIERAYVQLISKLLGLKFDAIWKRHKRLLIEKCLFFCLGIIGVAVLLWFVWVTNQPFSLNLQLRETPATNAQLPPLHDAIVDIYLDDEIKRDTIKSIDSSAVFKNIPHHYLGRTSRIRVNCTDYNDVDTTVTLDYNVKIYVSRNPIVYGGVRFRLWDVESERYLPNITVSVEDNQLTTDSDGLIQTFIPLESQKAVYHISSSVPLQKDSIVMPCADNEVLFVGNKGSVK